MRYSLTTKITTIFAIAFTLVCLLFLTFYNMEKEHALERLRDKQVSSINYLLVLYERDNPPRDLSHYFKNFGLEYIKNKKVADKIINKGELVFARQTPLGLVQSILYQDQLYLQLKNKSFQLLLENKDVQKAVDTLWVGFLIVSVLLISLYMSVIKSLVPLKKLHKDIRKFAGGNMDVAICCPTYTMVQQDEIGQVAYEFNNAVCKIRELIDSRQLFLRAIMHELKTPIGKGRIVSEMIINERQKTRLIGVFERLDMLINEFGKIEQVLSKNYSPIYQECHFSLIVEQVSDMLMLENFEEKVCCNIEDDSLLNVDFQLFSLAIKNLVDNALKYADDKKVDLLYKDKTIYIKNKGKKLEYDISHYKQAFVRGSDGVKNSTGMGLGLYIVEQICNMHKYKFEYEYKDECHCFKISKNNINKA